MTFNSTSDAFELLESLNASERLLKHAKLVLEVAQILLEGLDEMQVTVSHNVVKLGAVLHDVGKTAHPEELDFPGDEHEVMGKQLLLGNGIDEQIAEISVSHAKWDESTPLEALCVALADKLWKGKRVVSLEKLMIDRCFRELDVDNYWDVFIQLDTFFEEIAADGETRLKRSL
ncbi:MAG: HD domain-containing protein [Aggregatilineales bacterium]